MLAGPAVLPCRAGARVDADRVQHAERGGRLDEGGAADRLDQDVEAFADGAGQGSGPDLACCAQHRGVHDVPPLTIDPNIRWRVAVSTHRLSHIGCTIVNTIGSDDCNRIALLLHCMCAILAPRRGDDDATADDASR